MQQNSYDLSASSGESGVYIYSFQSIGPKGIILKKIEFIQLHDDSGLLIPFFNLAFGDTDADGSLKDHVVSDNGDMETVLNTVAAAVEDFLIKNPEASVYAQGLTASRTWLYQRKLRKYHSLIMRDFSLWGLAEGTWRPFEGNINYEAFVIHKKR
jgi:hypothetical protein